MAHVIMYIAKSTQHYMFFTFWVRNMEGNPAKQGQRFVCAAAFLHCHEQFIPCRVISLCKCAMIELALFDRYVMSYSENVPPVWPSGKAVGW